jgi:hypothetical protein
MPAIYDAIINAIDAAILAGVSAPGELTVSGRTIRYRSLQDLYEIRSRYAAMQARASGKNGIRLIGIKTPGGKI